MSRDRRSNRDWDDDRQAARRAAKHADKKHGRSDFKQNIRDVIASGNIEEIEEMFDDEDERHYRR
jgi:hypothetical protein